MTNILRFNMDRAALVVAIVTILSMVGMLSAALLAPSANAALTDTDATATQTINDGVLAVEIRSDDTTGTSGSYALAAVTYSFSCQQATGTGTFGETNEWFYVDDPVGGATGWDLTVGGDTTTELWENAAPDTYYDFNEAGAPNGCIDDGATTDADAFGGQLTIDPAPGAFVNRSGGDLTGITEGTSDAFVEGSVDAIDIGASDATQQTGQWRYSGGTMTQYIPAAQAPDDYTLGMTITVAAN